MSDITVRIVLYGPSGELDRQTIRVFEDCGETISHHVIDAVQAWVLAPGDTIKIEEVA